MQAKRKHLILKVMEAMKLDPDYAELKYREQCKYVEGLSDEEIESELKKFLNENK